MFIEDFLHTEVMPLYANTHTETSGTGLQTTRFREDARDIIHRAVGGAEDDIVLFRQGKNSLQSGGAVIKSLLARETFAIPAEGDHMRDAGLRGGGNERTVDFDQGIVVFPPVEGPLNASESALVFWSSSDRAGEAEGLDRGDFVGVKKIDALQSEVRSAFGEILKGEGVEAPATDGLGVRHEGRR